MADDPKVQFYLTHRELIQEWAALADPAAQALEQALLAASHEFAASAGGDLPVPRISPGGTTFIRLDITTAPLSGVWFELSWERRRLLGHGAGTWPSLRLVTSPQEPAELRAELKSTSAAPLIRHGLDQGSTSWWVRHGDLKPETEPINIDDFARDCFQRLATAYLEMRGPIRQVVEGFATRSRS
ncbi:hypothetical protein [Ornithinimicrobium faecis]|uniref:hypothetical protein n=1 Tax=Ornithinimicrobium faecis TaxID=2934158 RepID=UPI002119639C|nr:hypothetical protein [Ornithinimicrobium sp. HY1745]